MNQLLMSPETMVAVLVLSSMALCAVVLTLRSLFAKPVRQTVEVRRDPR